MEKLQIEHLAPYLPYELKIIHLPTKEQDKLTSLCHILGIGTNIDNYDFIDIDKVKPILRPLEDLFKEEFQEASHLTTILFDYEFDLKKEEIPYLSWLAIRYLFENHFDVFGLIDEDLAININTI